MHDKLAGASVTHILDVVQIMPSCRNDMPAAKKHDNGFYCKV